MCRVGIVTLWGNSNYGNRLQNYATERLVAELGFEPITIITRTPNNVIKSLKKSTVERIRRPQMVLRRKQFDAFNASLLHGERIEHAKKCDAYLCGSDQIWNYSFPEFSPDMFLSFAKGVPKASISASFGVSSIPRELLEFYKEMLAGLDYISVREETGRALVRDITGHDAEVLVDPTMAITASDWILFSHGARIPDKPYALTYFLGREPEGICGRIADELCISNTIALNSIDSSDYYSADPKEFVALISGADVVLTDSFHASAFAIMMNKRFVVCNRHSGGVPMGSRIVNLLSLFGISQNSFEELESLDCCIAPGADSKAILINEREKMRAFLDKTLASI